MADLVGEAATIALNAIKDGVTAIGSGFGVGVSPDSDLFQSKYDFTYRRFPMDLGEQSYNGHYMVININVQDGSRFDDAVTDSTGKKIRTFQKIQNSGSIAVGFGGQSQNLGITTSELSKVDVLRYNIDRKWKDDAEASFDTVSSFIVPRRTRRIVESIALYMPNTVVFDTSNDYEDVGLTKIGTDIATGAVSMAENVIPKSMRGFISKATRAGLAAVDTGSKLIQRPINPRIEVLFKNTLQRTFQFDFLFAPTSQDETIAMEQIIKTLRFHAAPEYSNTFGSFVYIPPSEFDITFFNRGVENTSIPRISTCALSKISVDYAPQGVWSTFRGTGSPVSCRMQIEFRELEVVSKLRVLQGF